jgi:CBS domain-containing protein
MARRRDVPETSGFVSILTGVRFGMNILHFITLKQEVAYLYSDFTMRQALEKMEYHQYSAIPIIDRQGYYVGTLTEGDLLWEVKNHHGLDLRKAESVPLSEIPRRTHNLAVRINTSIEELMGRAMNQNFVPVVDDRGVFIGIIKRRDIISYCYDQAFGGDCLGTVLPIERTGSF